jgi:hypothetical protein
MREKLRITMKNRLPFLALIAISLWGCAEKDLVIPELSVGARKVLVEELTGVKCSNCPDGTDLLVGLQETYGKENLIVVSNHAAPDFSVPYAGANGSLYDFRTTDGKALADFVGPFEAAPCAAIARFSPPNATSLFVAPPSEWPGLITAEFGKDYALGLYLVKEYNALSRQLDIRVNIAPGETLTGAFGLTVVITEDSIVDVQNVHSVIVKNYVHRHVLRDVVTQPNGNTIPEALVSGALISKTFSVVLPETWNDKHCAVVAYVHRTGIPDKVVLQAVEAHVVE